MKISVRPTNSTEYDIRLEIGDELYLNCMWARILFDHDHYKLYAETDCGNYTYGWPPTPNHESFLQLMARIDKEYLLSKISGETDFLIEKSKENTIQNIRKYYENILESGDLNDICEQIKDIDDASEEGFYRLVDDILDRYSCSDTFEIIHIEKDYPNDAKVFARFFCEVVQPEIKKQLAFKEAAGVNKT